MMSESLCIEVYEPFIKVSILIVFLISFLVCRFLSEKSKIKAPINKRLINTEDFSRKGPIQFDQMTVDFFN